MFQIAIIIVEMANYEKMSTGLSSQEAQRRLFEELTMLLSSHITMDWLKEFKKMPYIIICSSLIAIVGILLVIEYVVTKDDERNFITLFQSLFLILLAAFNVGLFGWEVYILKTHKIRHLMVKLKSVFDCSCPWTSVDYPRSPISTIRGNLTVPAYRDGVFVNVPISLLVHGDLIEVDAGTPCPANAVLLDTTLETKITHIAINEVLPDYLFKEKDTFQDSDDKISFLPKVRPMKLVVKDSPVLALLDSSIARSTSSSFLTNEIRFSIHMILYLLVVVYIISVVVNVIRYFTLQNDFNDSWPELIIGIPVYTCLPLLLLQLPLVWSLMNLYGMARVTQLVDKGPLYFKVSGLARIKVFLQTLVVTIKLVFWCSHFPDYRVFHILGSLTSVCAVDKEYLLTSGFPSPEKLFFMRTEDITEENARKRSSKTKQKRRHHVKDELVEDPYNSSSSVAVDVKFEITCPDNNQEDGGAGDSQGQPLSMTGIELQVESSLPSVESVPKQYLSVKSKSDSSSVASDSVPFELITEKLSISPDPTSCSGIAFDDVNWQAHIGSLKPIGVNLLSTSHLSNAPFHLSPSDCCNKLQVHIRNSSCSCALAREIGVMEYFSGKFENELVLYSISNPTLDFRKTIHRRTIATTFMANSNAIVQPHIISAIMKEFESEKSFVMSRGSGDLIASCCSDFWDGKDLLPMTETERISIVEYYNFRSLSSYCVALAYSPLPEVDTALLPWKQVGIYIPPSRLDRNHSELSLMANPKENKTQLSTAEQVFKKIQCGQIFLGLVCLQFRPKQDVVCLIEDLYNSGIRFVQFTAENELRGKIFAQKLGLETDWNCFISLAQPTDEDKTSLVDDESSEYSSQESSVASSVLSVFNTAMSNIHAKLPKGIENIRPHIKKADNVPLLVPLFTDCNADTITEMIKIMQENSEVVLCLGNAWNHENMKIFSQADISLSLIPQYMDLLNCSVAETCALSTSNSSQNTSFVGDRKMCPSPLEVASYINSASCQLSFSRGDDVSLLSLIIESRRILSSLRLSLLFGLGSSLTLTVMMVLSSLFFLPPPLSSSHLLWFLIFIIPLMMLTFLFSPLDPNIKSLMPDKKKELFSNKWLIVIEFITLFLVTGAVTLVLFALTLRQICLHDIPNSTCHWLLGERGRANNSPWNGWRGDYEQGLLFSQDLTAFFTILYLVVLSIRFINRVQPIWKLWKFISWQYVLVMATVFLLQIVYFVVSQIIIGLKIPVISNLNSIPVLVWCIGFVWPFFIVLFLEILKSIDNRKHFEAQTLLKLQFGTKLGVHSPYH